MHKENSFPVFRHWVPEWMIRVILFLVVLPSLVLFFLPLANIPAAAGYYGCEPSDIQYAVALFYAGYTGFYLLERRFFSFFASKEYFILFTSLQALTAFAAWRTDSLYVFFPLRLLQGMLFSAMVNLSLTLMFTHLRTERAREVSFSIFFGLLLCTVPFNNLVTADLVDSFDFNILYKCAAFSYLPSLFLILLTMNNVHLHVKFPLYNLDWQSFLLYTTILCLAGFVLIYGQEYYWLEDKRIAGSVIAIVLLGFVYAVRQRRMRRPYMRLSVFRSRNFNVAILLLFIMYICRFASGVTNTFFASVLKFDPMHVSYINVFNIAGLIVGVFVACLLILQRYPIRFIWLTGFMALLVFHGVMYFLFDTQADEDHFFIPLFVQGLGVGMIMVPTIVFSISSVPVVEATSAAAVCLAVRFLGFCAAISAINYFELLGKGRHYNAFQDHLTKLDPEVRHTLALQTQQLVHKGIPASQAGRLANRLLVNALGGQNQLRFAMDYYEMMFILLAGTLLLILCFPFLSRTVVYLKRRVLSPA
ncbi:MFS transporter [Chitinophaga parva]|nr:beta-carotene 15,15'-monooxygenase [Chitinophaga parva]